MQLPNIDRARLDAERIALIASICRDSFADFCRYHWEDIEPNGRPLIENRGTEALWIHLQAVGQGLIRRLGIAIAPGFGKSSWASVAFPAWMWTRDPAWRPICASHGMRLAEHIAGRARRLIESDKYRALYGIRLTSESIASFENQYGGKRFSTGVGGALTGFRGDGGIIDDAINAVDAHSDLELEKAANWFDTAFFNRLDRGETAPIVVIGQRLAEADLLGHLFGRGGYEQLVLPSEFESGRRCVTSVWRDDRETDGELLAPTLHSAEYLDEQRKTLGSYAYASQYQQRPAPLEGGMIKRAWWRWWARAAGRTCTRPVGCTTTGAVVVERFDQVLISVDAAFGASPTSSRVGLLVVGTRGADRFVIEDRTKAMTFPETLAAIRQLRADYPQTGTVLVERKANGQAIIDTLSREIAGVIGFMPKGPKEGRAAGMSPAIESGHVYLLDGSPWADAFVDELAVFPNGAHDDRVDALAQALERLAYVPLPSFAYGSISSESPR